MITEWIQKNLEKGPRASLPAATINCFVGRECPQLNYLEDDLEPETQTTISEFFRFWSRDRFAKNKDKMGVSCS